VRQALIFGASGMIGSAIVKEFESADFLVLRATSRDSRHGCVPISGSGSLLDEAISGLPEFDSVVWAHGINLNDRVNGFELANLQELLEINVLYTAKTLSALLAADKVVSGARLVVISSIWQESARSGKFSYTISKAAVGGLVRASAADLADRNILVNAILPGVLDGPMTRANLSTDQLDRVRDSTDFHRLATAQDVAKLALFLCSEENKSITGHSFSVDLGFSSIRQL
jgi:3-oxoacyl-[acyl-carrier protein] reductase